MSGISIKVDMGSAPELMNRLLKMQMLRRGIAAAATHLKSRIAIYPHESHRPQPFKTDRQRRGFFAKLRAGEIEAPYRRGQSPNSEKLGQSWVVELRDDGLTGVVGTRVRYAPLAQGSKQSLYHKVTGWRTVEDVGKAEAPAVARIVGAEIEGNL